MPDDGPLILAFDTSAAHCAAALVSGDTVLAQACEEMAKGQAERLLALCSDLLAQCGRTTADLDAIGVGTGPGNFTGIRISVSAARGLALGLGIPAIGVNSFEALALGAQTPCLATVDARRDQVFVQGFGATPFAAPGIVPATDVAAANIPIVGVGGRTPLYPLAEAIARITATRIAQDHPRPSPLYLRAADAAPARDAPPTIIP
ncbi:tRNA (adenosine(37)-N6)-threonylcarbamoyltransferase complex dimerization subunit type 1 TsaB [Sulfitobacter sp. S190]|uniref:tRNA (adenosine(37)-N6)-threonylcarbamoyltransferase complex dimerization subunit type 1 TsaB n=1 Tax=Sulfitobacter sp. S190 TaxID=2867022 RepID=UPI0021A530D7|nr:tRNA (adenosine(37)-N6)-threonylcarbamoyltransferase complex dimerization subunit type 1 TsaB [Sulfitobacter sp. S190]UWR21658.1 tRNA (adenosine(37)-N6)-threonylcarbamoyltransferase complex dimerization subunit type 1 TsaB [Sulfitobacter sp. S190]